MICIYLKEGPESGWNGILVFYKHNLILIKFTAWGDRQIFKQIFQKTKEKTLNVKSYDGLRLFFHAISQVGAWFSWPWTKVCCNISPDVVWLWWEMRLLSCWWQQTIIMPTLGRIWPAEDIKYLHSVSVYAVQSLTLILLLCFIPPVSTLFKNKITLYNISANFCKIVKVSSRKIRQQTAKYLFIFIFIESQLIDFTFDTG